MDDVIAIKTLRVETRIGVKEAERAAPRTVTINIAISTDTSAAGRSDDLGDTVDYAAVIEEVAALVGGREFRLLEHLAEEVAGLVAAKIGVRAVTVEVEKDDPPVAASVGAVAVKIERPGT